MQNQTNMLLNRNRNLTDALLALMDHAATCKGENDAVWMRLLADRLDYAAVALESTDRFIYRDTRGIDWIEKVCHKS